MTLMAVLGALLAAAPGSSAAGTGVTGATLGHVCDRGFHFTITANGVIPAGSTWDVSTTRASDLVPFQAIPNNPLVQRTQASWTRVTLRATQDLPSGAVVRVTPSYYNIPWTGTTTLTIAGYGGTHQVPFTRTSNPC